MDFEGGSWIPLRFPRGNGSTQRTADDDHQPINFRNLTLMVAEKDLTIPEMFRSWNLFLCRHPDNLIMFIWIS